MEGGGGPAGWNGAYQLQPVEQVNRDLDLVIGAGAGAPGEGEVFGAGIEVDREQNLNDIFARLSETGIEVLSMRNKVNRLEDFFMKLVEGKGNGSGAGTE